MKNILNQIIILLLLLSSSQVHSNAIKKIDFIGLNNTSESNLIKLLPFSVGENYSSSKSDEIIKSLFATGFFSDISINENDGTLEIILKENPIIKYIEFETTSDTTFSSWINGDKPHLSNDQLSELSKNNSFVAGNVFTNGILDEFISIIESAYNESGFFNIDLKSNIELDNQNRMGIKILINQGNRATIENFKISGNEKFSSQELLNLFKIGEADIFFINYFTNKDLYSEEEFSKGINLLTNKYFDSGYLDFLISDVDTSLNESKENVSIEIKVKEGVQYTLGDVVFKGDLGNIDLVKLNNIISMNKGDIFNRDSIINDIQKLTDLYADEGYAFVEVNPITSEVLNQVNINFDISLNKKVYINRITISGNTRTQDEVIRREIGISEGGLYSRSILRDSLLNLRRLGYFSDVQISTSEVKGMPDKIDIAFSVEETQTGTVSLSMSHSNNYGVSFGAGIQEKNIFGTGNTLNAELKISESFNKISFYFMNPNFNDEGHSVSFGAFKSEINDDDVAENSYEIDTKGLTIGYGIPMTDNSRINSNFEYSNNVIKCSTLFSGTGYEPSQCASSKNDEFKANINWSKNTLNNYLYPTEGINNSLSTGVSLPLGDYRYFNINANHSSYKPINNSTTLKLTGNLNLSKGYSGKNLPFYKRHFGGGSGSVRGFGNKTLGPLYPNGKAKGGELSILGSANIITPAFFFDNNEKMRMSAFIDAGNVYEKSSNIKLGDLRMSAGFGFAYLSPIGSIGAFVSTPILKKDGDTIENFGFSLGTGF